MAHKVVSPTTYECDLCALTHGSFTEKNKWKDFRNSNFIEMEFYHKDEFLSKYKSKWLSKYTFPIILYSDGERLEPFITAAIFKEIKTVEELIENIKTFLNTNKSVEKSGL
ncbi:GTPase [Dokdonia sp.]|uniref:GTPase n=1 Tax=Dokdonia sp. TaxID=2024995 RepID=UPI0032675150